MKLGIFTLRLRRGLKFDPYFFFVFVFRTQEWRPMSFLHSVSMQSVAAVCGIVFVLRKDSINMEEGRRFVDTLPSKFGVNFEPC